MLEIEVTLRQPHEIQEGFIDCENKRIVIRAGRRGGKTVGAATRAIKRFLGGRRVLYAAPTEDQIGAFWYEVKRALSNPIDAGIFVKNETMHFIELPGTKQRIRAKTAYNADTLRGDYADELILDEFQMMDEDAWGVVGAPMLADNDGNATLIYTPPSLRSRSASKARDPRHASKLFQKASLDKTGRWAVFHFSSRMNPYISQAAVDELAGDMTGLAYRMEILAEDVDEAPGALWTRDNIEKSRVLKAPDLTRIVVGVDPSATSGGDEAGIITAGRKGDDYFTLADDSIQGSPEAWARASVLAYNRFRADCIVAEKNNGGEMVESVIKQVDPMAKVKLVWASRGKATRAEPISAISEQGRDHHVGSFPALEDELCLWLPGDDSPNRLDAKVWGITELMGGPAKIEFVPDPFAAW